METTKNKVPGKNSKKIIIIAVSITLAVLLLLGAFFTAIAGVGILIGVVLAIILTSSEIYSDFETTQINGGCVITNASNAQGDVVIPDVIDNMPVIAIGEEAFYDAAITSVQLPSTLKSIDTGAFDSCTSLVKIEIPDSCEYIGDNAFYGCTSLKTAKVGNSVRYIGKSAFADCTSLEQVTLGNGLEEIDAQAFAYCTSLNYIGLGSSIEKIGSSAFISCLSLQSIDIPSSVNEISEGAFWLCENLTNVRFKNTNGWSANNLSLLSSDLANGRTAATYLTNTYSAAVWINQ